MNKSLLLAIVCLFAIATARPSVKEPQGNLEPSTESEGPSNIDRRAGSMNRLGRFERSNIPGRCPVYYFYHIALDKCIPCEYYDPERDGITGMNCRYYYAVDN